ncbi:unnamed protein product [Protopolystoma xenopodis]|uniref:Uncharacterized protein n=1 Tax=Protopolystoma xenopodis TaxID=117903 RepID=A0A448WUX0_9PLAT|nr:unnamed protein product [Protopolystoma xenopodis]
MLVASAPGIGGLQVIAWQHSPSASGSQTDQIRFGLFYGQICCG